MFLLILYGYCSLFQLEQIELWTRPIEPQGSWAFVVFNSAVGMPSAVSVKLSDLGMHNAAGYNVSEVFDGVAMGVMKPTDVLKVSVNPTGVFFGKAAVIP